ncbi:iron-siderophore ABC transporter substrate-binding protein [Gordonia malaquae]|uniref:iron-siderophore ABC transporter substrate-binding protein n=1 Tax=Gordonia malaquae TaxID=410332 RepID=UPI0030FE9C26
MIRRSRPRRATSLLALVCAAALTVAIAGCSTPTDDVGPGAVTVAHKYGQTVVPADPKRVVTVGWSDQDYVLSLGIVPVATRAWFDNYSTFPWVQKATGGQKLDELSGDGIDFESIAKAKPDVIFAIYESIDQKTYDRLSQIAPTVIQSADYPDEETPWNVVLTTVGKALGKSTEADRLVQRVQSRIDETKKAHPEFTDKVLVVNFSSDPAYYLLGTGDPRRALFDALGFAAQDTKGDVSNEKVSLLDGDVLFMNGLTKAQLASNPSFQRLDVVSRDRTLYAGSDSVLSGALAYGGPDALLYALDTMVPQLSNALTDKPVADLSNA